MVRTTPFLQILSRLLTFIIYSSPNPGYGMAPRTGEASIVKVGNVQGRHIALLSYSDLLLFPLVSEGDSLPFTKVGNSHVERQLIRVPAFL